MIAAGSTARAARSLCRWEVGFEENTGAGQDMAYGFFESRNQKDPREMGNRPKTNLNGPIRKKRS